MSVGMVAGPPYALSGAAVSPPAAAPTPLATLQMCRDKFRFFSKTCLKIQNKEGKLVPFELNAAQEYVDSRAEDMLARKGYVRLIILKGRQQGISTWAQARAYHKTSLWHNTSAFVLSHHGSTTDTIFEISDRYHRHNPIAPHTGAANSKQLKFDLLSSSYEVATAGSKEVGRGGTRQFFHGSEVGFWENALDHFAASVNSVGLVPGTWIILESTANGVTGEFYRRWQNAVAGIGDYEAVFIPWYWQPEYRRPTEPGFRLSEVAEEGELSEAEYAEMYGCDLEQMAWRRNKIIDDGPIKFKQEYPATAEEAFQSADTNSYIPALPIMRARKAKFEAGGPLIIGVDPAGPGGDRFSVAYRRGRVCQKIEWRDRLGSVAAVEWLKDIIDKENPAAVFIDAGGLGDPLIQFLRAKGPKYDRVVHSVNFGSKSQAKMAQPNKAGPVNRRAEMWQRTKAWLEQEGGAQIPDLDALQGDLTAPSVKPETNNNLLLTSKSDLKAKGVRSPDLADALALTFASAVYVEDEPEMTPMEQALLDRPVQSGYDGFNGTHSTSWMG